jgi:hypothetical protein
MPTPEELENMSKPEILALARKRAWGEIIWGVGGLATAVTVFVIGGPPIWAGVSLLAGAFLGGKGVFELASVNEIERPIGRNDKE